MWFNRVAPTSCELTIATRVGNWWFFASLLATFHPCTWVLGATGSFQIHMESVSTRSQKVNCALQFQESNLKNFLQPTFFFVSREAYQVWLWAMPHRQRFEPSGAQHNLSEFTCDSARKKTTNAPEKNLPSGYVKIAIENGPVEIVDLPINSIGGFSIVFCRFTRPGRGHRGCTETPPTSHWQSYSPTDCLAGDVAT